MSGPTTTSKNNLFDPQLQGTTVRTKVSPMPMSRNSASVMRAVRRIYSTDDDNDNVDGDDDDATTITAETTGSINGTMHRRQRWKNGGRVGFHRRRNHNQKKNSNSSTTGKLIQSVDDVREEESTVASAPVDDTETVKSQRLCQKKIVYRQFGDKPHDVLQEEEADTLPVASDPNDVVVKIQVRFCCHDQGTKGRTETTIAKSFAHSLTHLPPWFVLSMCPCQTAHTHTLLSLSLSLCNHALVRTHTSIHPPRQRLCRSMTVSSVAVCAFRCWIPSHCQRHQEWTLSVSSRSLDQP